jgi:hypothetical protein
MKKIILISFIVFPFLCSAQIDVGLQLGTNYPIDYSSNENARKFGGELQLQLTKDLKNNFGIESGLLVDTYTRTNANLQGLEEDASFLRLQIYIPLLAYYKFYDNRITLKSGLLPGVRNFLAFTKYSGTDPEINFEDKYYPSARQFVIDFSVGIDYQISNRFGIFMNYRTPFNSSKQDYGILSCGVNFKIVSH